MHCGFLDLAEMVIIDDRQIMVRPGVVGIPFQDVLVLSHGFLKTPQVIKKVPEIEIGLKQLFLERHVFPVDLGNVRHGLFDRCIVFQDALLDLIAFRFKNRAF